jgi:hypothetical protein
MRFCAAFLDARRDHTHALERSLMAEHKFRAGQRVTLVASFTNRRSVSAGYVVTKQLPERGGEFEYRIKGVSEPHERVARESELTHEWPRN